ncbi:hypothetical protein [Labrys sp. 22185]|uniref:hypothetical protein n=1 Tax=Labrys sp. 22185 TaxID=3453888 RepID=UPI003F83D95C
MSRPSSTITLPAARAEQLRRLAAARNVSVVAALEGLLSEAVARGELPDELPGFAVQVVGESVVVSMPGQKGLVRLPATDWLIIQSMATMIERLATNDMVGRGYKIQLEADCLVTLGRTGRGIVVKVEGASTDAVSMTGAVALDLVRLIRSAIETIPKSL